MKKLWSKITKMARDCFSYIWNRQFLTFLFFFFLSFIFWIFFTLNETYEQDFSIPLELKNKPKNITITMDPPKEIVVTIRDKGSKLLQYSGSGFAPVQINFKDYVNKQGQVKISVSDLRRQIESQLGRKSTLVRLRPENIEYMYNNGDNKTVPIIFDDVQALPAKGYIITGRYASVNRARIYAQKSMLDTISAVYARPSFFNDVKGRQRFSIELAPMRGVKMEPDSVFYTVVSDIVNEKTVQAKVHGVNFPATKTLRTFPGTVNITFKVPASQYNNITADDFVLVLDYESLLNAKSNKVRLNLKSLPKGVSSAAIHPQDVQFLIEQLPESSDDE